VPVVAGWLLAEVNLREDNLPAENRPDDNVPDSNRPDDNPPQENSPEVILQPKGSPVFTRLDEAFWLTPSGGLDSGRRVKSCERSSVSAATPKQLRQSSYVKAATSKQLRQSSGVSAAAPLTPGGLC
jgi:hypothetical protein